MWPVGRRSELVGVVSLGTHREILSMARGRASVGPFPILRGLMAQAGGPVRCSLGVRCRARGMALTLRKLQGPTLTTTGITGPDPGCARIVLRVTPFVTYWAPSTVGSSRVSLQAGERTPCSEGRLHLGPPALLVWHAHCCGYASGGDARPRSIGLGHACWGAVAPSARRGRHRTIASQPSYG
jgi:hypothetical protein